MLVAEHEAQTSEPADPEHLASRIGYRFANAELLAVALTHRSWPHEQPDPQAHPSNERLEFLGDSVLDLCVCEHAMARWPELGPGELSAVRSEVVSAEALARAARACDLGLALRLGRGEDHGGGRDRESILADAFEAVLGAVYLDGGFPAAREMVVRLLAEAIEVAAAAPGGTEAKSRLQELTVRCFGSEPTYRMSSSGPSHRPTFTAEAVVNGTAVGTGTGATKRSAQRRAARAAYAALQEQEMQEQPCEGHHKVPQNTSRELEHG